MAFSAANPLLPSTPTVLHAARWGPQASSGPPHWQVQTVKGKGMQRRRSKRTRNGSESIFDNRWTGNAVNGTDARGHSATYQQPRPHHMVSVVFVDRLGCVFLPCMTHVTRLTPRMPLLDRIQTVCPTTPMGSVPDLRTATNTQTAEGHGQGGHLEGVGRQVPTAECW